MSPAALVIIPISALLLALGSLLLRTRWRAKVSIAAVAVAAIATATAFVERGQGVPEAQVEARPIAEPHVGYVGSATCRSCHPHEHATWDDSYHSSMTQIASPATVLGDFDDVEMSVDGRDYRLLRTGSEFWVELMDPYPDPGKAPELMKRRITMITGSHHMQVYWFETGYRRTLGQLPFSWQIAEQRWISRAASFVLPPDDNHDEQYGSWNFVCIKCHATHGRPLFATRGGQMGPADTRVAELGIGCESCHGPGAEHVAANQNPARRYAQRLSDEPDPTIINPANLSAERSTQVCGSCHAVWDYKFNDKRQNKWFIDGFRYRPGDNVQKNRALDFKGQGIGQFWPDGLVRTAGREYNALAGSPCYEKGEMSCLSCHVLHQPVGDSRSRAEWADDQLHGGGLDRSCLECHPTFADDVPGHSHHEADSTGSSCVNCHMPHTIYGLMKGVRNHRIANPSVASSLETGRPNACNQCHMDKTLAWTATYLKEWYGTEEPKLSDEDKRVAATVRWALRGDAAQRALMAWTFGWSSAQQASGRDWLAPYLAELLDDPYPAVRIIAERSLRTLPGYESFRHDLDGAPELRAAAKAAALSTWRASATTGETARPELLLTAEGKLQSAEFESLLKKRSNRKMRLIE